MKTPVLRSLYSKVAALQTCNFLKRDYNTGVYKNSFLYRTPPVAASDSPTTVQ